MTERVAQLVRVELKRLLPQLTEQSEQGFRRIYCPVVGISPHESGTLPLEAIVDKIAPKYLASTLDLVDRTIEKYGMAPAAQRGGEAT